MDKSHNNYQYANVYNLSNVIITLINRQITITITLNMLVYITFDMSLLP